jgi:hypothetical protein
MAPLRGAILGYGLAYCALVVATVLLPSGKMYDFNVKYTIAAVLLACGVFAWRAMPSAPGPAAHLGRLHFAVLLYVAAIVAIWSAMAPANGFDPLPEVRSMLGPLVLIAAYHPLLVPRRWLLDSYCAAAAIYAVAKLAVIFGLHAGVIDPAALITTGSSVFGLQLVASPTCEGAPIRITLPNDLAVALLPLVLLDERYRKPWIYAAVALCGLAVLASFSRYLVIAFLAVVALTVWQVASLRAKLATAGALLVVLVAAHAVGAADCLLERLVPSSEPETGAWMNRVADDVRKEQVERLGELIASKPLLGHGVGSYHRGYIRSEQMPYAYELQLLSFAAKFGLIGLGLLVLGALLLSALHFRRAVAPWLVMGILGASGLTNPFYESSAFGVAFVLTMVAFSPWTSRS